MDLESGSIWPEMVQGTKTSSTFFWCSAQSSTHLVLSGLPNIAGHLHSLVSGSRRGVGPSDTLGVAMAVPPSRNGENL